MDEYATCLDYCVQVFPGNAGRFFQVDNADQRLTQDVNQVTILAGRLAFGNYQVNESVPFLMLQSIASIVFVSAQVRGMVWTHARLQSCIAEAPRRVPRCLGSRWCVAWDTFCCPVCARSGC